MTHKMQHRLVGYSRKTDEMVEAHAIPAELLDAVKNIAHVGTDDPDAIYDYVLDGKQIGRIAEVLNMRIQFALEYFLEPDLNAEADSDDELPRRATA